MGWSRPRFSIEFLVLILIVFLVPSGLKAQALKVLVRDRVLINSDTIRLGDIATFNPDSDERVAQLKEIPVTAAPAPGQVFHLNSRFLIYKIRTFFAGIDDVLVKIPDSLVVQRKAQTISVARLRKIFKQYILSHCPWPAKRIRFEKIAVAGPVNLPEGHVHWEIKNRGKPDYIGEVALVVGFLVDQRLIKKVPLAGTVSVELEVVKAAKKIKKGEIISSGDLILATERRVHLREGVVHKIDEVIGKRAVRVLQPGQVITKSLVDEPPAVKKGERVVIKAENRQILVTAQGKALEDGRAGDQIRVVNTSSGKEIFGTVEGPKLVAVAF